MSCLQHHKEKFYGDNQPITSFDNLPSDMQTIFYCMQKCAYERFLCHSNNRPLSEQEISEDFFNCSKVPRNFDGFGLFSVTNTTNTSSVGMSKFYNFSYKPVQELLAALYLTQLQPPDLLQELSDTFGKKEYEMVWIFYAGLTDLKQVPIENVLAKHRMQQLSQQVSINLLPVKSLKDLVEVWKKCHTYYLQMITGTFNMEFLLSLILCCYEAKNSEACKVIANHLYADKVCRFEVPSNHATPYLLLAISYFILHSGKIWSLRCNVAIQSSIQLLFEHINKNGSYQEDTGNLWVFCCVVTSSEIDVYCSAIKSQPSLQWIHLLPGSHLGDDGTEKLCKCLCFDNHVIKIEIDDCGIGSDGLESIGRMLNYNKNILCLNLRKNNFTLDDIKEFLQNIKNQQILQVLLFDKSYCEDSDVHTILKDINSIRSKNNAHHWSITYR